MTAVGKGYVATLTSDMRGPVERRPATTRREAFAAARDLLDVAERREWHRSEVVSVQVAQTDQ